MCTRRLGALGSGIRCSVSGVQGRAPCLVPRIWALSIAAVCDRCLSARWIGRGDRPLPLLALWKLAHRKRQNFSLALRVDIIFMCASLSVGPSEWLDWFCFCRLSTSRRARTGGLPVPTRLEPRRLCPARARRGGGPAEKRDRCARSIEQGIVGFQCKRDCQACGMEGTGQYRAVGRGAVHT